MEINHYANKVIKWALHFTMMSVMLFHIIKSLYCNVSKSCTFKYCRVKYGRVLCYKYKGHSSRFGAAF